MALIIRLGEPQNYGLLDLPDQHRPPNPSGILNPDPATPFDAPAGITFFLLP
jgi:hypothetical protein